MNREWKRCLDNAQMSTWMGRPYGGLSTSDRLNFLCISTTEIDTHDIQERSGYHPSAYAIQGQSVEIYNGLYIYKWESAANAD